MAAAALFLLLCSGTGMAAGYPEGGINSQGGETAGSRTTTEVLEAALLAEGYVAVNGENADGRIDAVTDGRRFFFMGYLDEERYPADKYRVYLPEGLLDEAYREASEGGLSIETETDLNACAVIIDYKYWDSREKAGTVSTEYGDGLPAGTPSGTIRITAPAGVRVEMLCEWEQTRFVFYVSKDRPFETRLKAGRYYVTKINGQEFREGAEEDSLPYGNAVVIREDAEFELDLTAAMEKYGIKGDDPEYAEGGGEGTAHTAADAQRTEGGGEREAEKRKPAFCFTVFLTAAGIGLMTALIIRKKRKGDEVNNEK